MESPALQTPAWFPVEKHAPVATHTEGASLHGHGPPEAGILLISVGPLPWEACEPDGPEEGSAICHEQTPEKTGHHLSDWNGTSTEMATTSTTKDPQPRDDDVPDHQSHSGCSCLIPPMPEATGRTKAVPATPPTVDSYKYSFVPRTIVDWNALPEQVARAESLDIFKQRLAPLQH